MHLRLWQGMKRGSAELVSQFAEGPYLLSKKNHLHAFVCGSAVVMVIPLSSSRYEAFKRERGPATLRGCREGRAAPSVRELFIKCLWLVVQSYCKPGVVTCADVGFKVPALGETTDPRFACKSEEQVVLNLAPETDTIHSNLNYLRPGACERIVPCLQSADWIEGLATSRSQQGTFEG